MKILLLNPPFIDRFSRAQRSPAVTKSGTLYYPLWLGFTTGVLEDAGYEVKLLDAPPSCLSRKETYSEIKEFKPHLIVVATSTPSIYNDMEIVDELGELLPTTKLVAVGTHVSALPGETFSLTEHLHIIARKEYDYTILELVDKLSSGGELDYSEISGISWRDGDEIIHNPDRPYIEDLDELPFLARVIKDHLNVHNYFFAAARYPMIMMITGRGCPFKCIFCVYPQTFHGRGYRLRTASDVAEEFAYIKSELPEVREVVIEDDTFSANKLRMQEISRLLIEQDNELPWSVNVRANLDYETMMMMKAAGCRLLIVGYEAGDPEILKSMHKGIKIDHLTRFADNARRANLLVHGCFMAGNPGEDRKSLSETLRISKRLKPDTAQYFPVMAYPGTETYNWAKEHDYLISDNFRDWITGDGLHNCVIRTKNLTDEELVRFCDFARRDYYLRPEYIFRKFWQSLFNWQEFKRNLLSFKNFFKHLIKRG